MEAEKHSAIDEKLDEPSQFFTMDGVESRMGIYLVRAMFLLIFAGAGWQAGVFLNSDSLIEFWPNKPTGLILWCILASVGLYFFVFAFEVGFGKVSVTTISAVLFGLIGGFIIANLFYSVISLLLTGQQVTIVGGLLKLGLTCIFCYLGVATIFKTRDRFSFIIPYVEFQREQRGPTPFLLDTSSIVDGRIADVAEIGALDVPLIIPRFVLDELQAVADSSDRLKRNRGRRGLDILNRLRHNRHMSVEIMDEKSNPSESVDRQLVSLAKKIGARIITTDSPLSKISELEGIEVLNLNGLANAMRPVLIPGEEITLELIRRGEEIGQAIGHIQDGTMVVIEHAESRIGSEVPVVITSILQRPSGRIVFGKLKVPSDAAPK